MTAITFGASFGSFGAGVVPAPTIVDWAADCERLGYEFVWYRDHVLWHSAVLDPFTMLGAIAARTSRVRLGPGVLLLPLRPPALVAKAIATLDVVSSGRAVLGVGVGGEFPKEFEACGVPRSERGRRTDEAIEAVRQLWTASPASFAGTFHRFDDVSMEPRPVQQPHPPIWVGGRSDAALRRAATRGDAWFAYFVSAERFRQSVEKIDELRDGARPFTFALVLYFCIASDRDTARRTAAEYLSVEYRQSFDSLVDRYCALGSIAECIDAIQRFVDAGARHIALIPAVPPDRVHEQLVRAAEGLVPAFRARA